MNVKSSPYAQRTKNFVGKARFTRKAMANK